MANIWRRNPSGRLISSDLIQKEPFGVSQLVADDFFESSGSTWPVSISESIATSDAFSNTFISIAAITESSIFLRVRNASSMTTSASLSILVAIFILFLTDFLQWDVLRPLLPLAREFRPSHTAGMCLAGFCFRASL